MQFSFEIDEVLAALNRDATQAKRAGDMELAVSLLRQAKARQGDMYQTTRLAKYLQHAGRLDDALAEIQWLQDKSAGWAKRMFGHQPASLRLQQQVRWRGAIAYAAALICKRAQRPDLERQYRQQHETLAALRDKLKPIADADLVERREERAASLPSWARR